MKKSFVIILECIILSCFSIQATLSEPDNTYSSLLEITKNQKSAKTKSSQLENLLKQLGLDFIKISDNCFKIPIDIDGETSVAYVEELSLIKDEPESRYILISQLILKFPDEYHPSVAMLKEMAYINNNYKIGTIGIDKELNAIIYYSSIWSDNLTKENLEREIYLSHYIKISLKGVLTNYINE